jgi:hypothetical protein
MTAKLRPEVIEIPFGSEKHKHVLEAIRQRHRMSRDYMSDRYPMWAKMEERFRAYVNLKETDRQRKELNSQGRPQYVTIDVPYSYAMLLTAHTYWTSVFLSRNPVLQFQGRSGETQMQEQAVEAVMDYQLTAGGMLMPLYLWFMDAGKYGLGVLGTSWYEEKRVVTEITEVPKTYYGIPVGGMKKVRQTRLINGYSGNRAFNIRPQDFFPDPRVPIYRLQDGEFCGRMVEVGWNTIIEREADGFYYNVAEMQKRLKTTQSYLRETGSPQLVLPAGMDTLYYRREAEDPYPTAGSSRKKQKAFIETLEMVIEIVPKDWQLGESTYPEKWAFTVGNDEVILCAMPTGAYHGKFEFFPLEYEIEGYALSKRSMLEIVDPLNDVMSWLFNSHMYNVRKVLNDQLIVDPSRLTMKDMTDPSAGRLVRLKPEAYGTDPKTTWSQLAVQDVTQQHMANLDAVGQFMQRILGVTENVMGMVNQGGRKTATEVRTSSTFGVNRLKTNCEYMSAMGFTPWAQVLLANTQQRFSDEKTFRIAGRSVGAGTPYVDVTPDSIAGSYDFTPVDGTMPIDRFAQANLWKELATAMRAMPEVAMGFDWVGIMGWIAQLSGAKNFDQFKIQANVVPDGSIPGGVQSGNLVPIQGGKGGGPASGVGPAGGGAPGGSPIPGPATVPGVGRVG